jgi:3-methyl-2-oxobutanoate hydroxymethyltransferase
VNKVTIAALNDMKRDGRKIVAVVAWDTQIARIADRAGVDLVSVGDSVGINLWGHADEADITLDEMLVVCKAVRRGITRALISCDLPAALFRSDVECARAAAMRLVDEGGAELVKLDGAVDFPERVAAVTGSGIRVFAQMEPASGTDPAAQTARLVADAKRLEEAGAVLIDFKHSGPIAGPAVAAAVSIPVLGGLGGGPWLDGRLRMAHAALGYAATNLDSPGETYANVAQIAFNALSEYAQDVRAGRQIKGQRRAGL